MISCLTCLIDGQELGPDLNTSIMSVCDQEYTANMKHHPEEDDSEEGRQEQEKENPPKEHSSCSNASSLALKHEHLQPAALKPP